MKRDGSGHELEIVEKPVASLRTRARGLPPIDTRIASIRNAEEDWTRMMI